MPISATLKAGFYKDSVTLMRIAQLALAEAGVDRATLLMGTPANKATLGEAGLLDPAIDAARPNDLMIVVEAQSSDALDATRTTIERMLEGEATTRGLSDATEMPPRSLAMQRARAGSSAVLAQISVPGPYAAAEALKALRQGLHVFLFSDNVPLAQERVLKRVAERKGLLVMGPDCGTAMLRGVPLGFANAVRRGSIGLVGASGTGLQEVMCRIHELGEGVSHAIGTGSHDVHAEIGGVTMRQAIDLLAADPATRVIAIVSKPPAAEVAATIVERLARTQKPAVVLFLGADTSRSGWPATITAVGTLEDAARAAVLRSQGRPFEAGAGEHDEIDDGALAPSQRYIRALYSGGTFCTEAQLVWRDLGIRARSNAPLDGADALDDPLRAQGHAAIDFGADEFTVGRPHPMIDLATRIEAIGREARDPSVAALVLDVVLGFGSHPDPAGGLAPAIAQARALAQREGRHLHVVAFVCGTDDDPQRLSQQKATLRDAGAIVCAGSTAAARAAGAIVLTAARSSSREAVAQRA